MSPRIGIIGGSGIERPEAGFTETVIDTPYGRALSLKQGLLIFLLVLGAQNLKLRGREPFGTLVRIELALAIAIFVATGFLTSLPPANADQPTAQENQAPSIDQSLRQPPMPKPPETQS